MKAFFALLCLGVALAEVPSSISEYKTKNIKESQFAPGKQYEYYYDSQILNGIPQTSNRRSGQRIQCQVNVQVPSLDVLIVQLKHIRFGSLNERVPSEDRRILSVNAFNQVHLKSEDKEKLEKPIKVSRKDGLITDLRYSSSEPSWVVNIKRSVLNLLSTNLKAKNEIVPSQYCAGGRCNSPPSRIQGEKQFFKAYEETVEGSCETTYTVVKNPCPTGRSDHVLNVTKSINLSKCKSITPGKKGERPEIRYNFHLSDVCPTCHSTSKFINASTVMKMDLAGTRDSHLVEQVSSISEYIIPDFSPEGTTLSSKVNQSLILIETKAIATPLRAPESSSPRHGRSLVYSLSWDAMKEKFFMDGTDEFLTRSPYTTNADKVGIAKTLLKELARQLSPSKPQKNVDIMAPTTFLRLVKVMRMLKSEELEKIHSEAFSSDLAGVEPEEAQAIKDLVHTAMGAAGTQPCTEHILEKIKSSELSQYQASIAIRQLQNARVVSKKMVDEVKSLVSSIDQNEKPALKQASMLALGSLVRSFCMPRDNKFAINQHESSHSTPEKCTAALRKEIVEFFVEYIKNSQKWNHHVLAIKSLENAALPESIPELGKIIKSPQYKEIVRSQAVLALKPLRSIVPEQVIRVCMPVYMDKTVPTPIRIPCAYLIITSNPSPAVLRSMVVQLEKDEPKEIKSFVFSFLSSLANSTSTYNNPCNEKLCANAKLALQYMKERSKVIAGTLLSYSSMHSYAKKFGLDMELYSIMSNSSFVPIKAGMNINSKFMGLFNRDILSLGFQAEHLDGAIRKMVKEFWSEPESRVRRSTPSVTELRQKLVEMTRNYEETSPEFAKILLQAKVLGQQIGFVPLDKHIKEYIEDKFSWSQIEAAAQPLNLNLASLVSEYMYKIPTAMGLPLVVRTQTPIIVQLKGSLGKQSDSNYLVRDIDMLTSILAKTELTVEVWSPVVNAGIKVREQGRISVPVRASVKRISQSSSNAPRFALEIKTPSSEGRELVTLKTTPYSFIREWDQSSTEYTKPKMQIISPVEQSRVTKIDKSVEALGVKVQLRGRLTDVNPERSGPCMSPLRGPHTLHIITRKAPSVQSEKIVFKAYYAPTKLVQQPLQSDVHALNTQEYGSSEESSEESQSFSSAQHYETKLHIQAQALPSKVFRAVNILYKSSPDSRLQKTEMKAYKDESQSSPVYCAESQILYPEYPQKTSHLNRKVNARHIFAWGPNCQVSQSNKKIQILEQGERTKSKRVMEEQLIREYQYCKDGKRSPIECFDYIYKASELNKYSYLITYPDMPVWAKNYTQKVFSWYMSWNAYNADINKYDKGTPNQIKAVVRVDPYNPRIENVTIHEPGQKVIFKDVPVTLNHRAYNMVIRSRVPVTFGAPVTTMATCQVSDRKIQTFDEAVFKAPVTDCWAVLAKDCTSMARFAVLMKRLSMGSPAKKIRVVTKTQLIEISKDSDNFVMRVDGAEKNIPESKLAEAGKDAYARMIGESSVRIVLPKEGVTVYFDGETAAVQMSPLYFTQQCGLCGHFNGDHRDIFRGTKGQRQQSIVEFFKQYQIQEGSCKVTPADPKLYHHDESSESYSSESLQSRYRSKSTVSPVLRNRISHENGQICVSTSSVKTCPRGYYAEQSVTQTLEFGCIADHYDGLEIEAMAHDSAISDLPEFTDRFSRSVRIASKCVRY